LESQLNRTKKLLQKIRMTGVAGVTDPAHEHDGWLVFKNDDSALRAALEEALLDRVNSQIQSNIVALDELRRTVERAVVHG
jgi:hypothetical protein